MADAPPVLPTDFTVEEEGEGKPTAEPTEPVEPQTIDDPTTLPVDDAIPRPDPMSIQDSTNPNLAQPFTDNAPPLVAGNSTTEPLQPRSVTSKNAVTLTRSDALFGASTFTVYRVWRPVQATALLNRIAPQLLLTLSRAVAIAPAMYQAGTSPASTHPTPGGNLVSFGLISSLEILVPLGMFRRPFSGQHDLDPSDVRARRGSTTASTRGFWVPIGH